MWVPRANGARYHPLTPAVAAADFIGVIFFRRKQSRAGQLGRVGIGLA